MAPPNAATVGMTCYFNHQGPPEPSHQHLQHKEHTARQRALQHDHAFELAPAANVHGGRQERLPNDKLVDICLDEQVDVRSETVPFLQGLVQEDDYQRHKNDYQRHEDELDDKKQADPSAEVGWLAVQPCKDIDRAWPSAIMRVMTTKF